MNWPDVLAVVLVVLLAIFGLRRGFWAEILWFLGVGLAFLASAWLAPRFFQFIPAPGTIFHSVLSAICFVAVLSVCLFIFGWLLGKARDWVPEFLSPVDRALGAALGAAKGVAFAGLVFFLFLQPMAPSSMRVEARQARIAPLALSLDVVALDSLSGPLPVFRRFSRTLGESLQRFQRSPGSAAIVARPVPFSKSA